MTTPVRVRIEGVVERFEGTFLSIFKTSKKAHFDSVPQEYRVVDGARTRWWPLLVLDAAMFLLATRTWNFATRRAFSQHKALFDAIVAELSENHKYWLESLSKQIPSIHPGQPAVDDTNESLLEQDSGWEDALFCSSKLAEVRATVETGRWGSFKELKESVLADPPSKAKAKFLLVTEYLLDHPLLRGRGLGIGDVFCMLVCKVAVHFVCGLFSDEPRPARSPHALSSLPQSFMYPRRVLSRAMCAHPPAHMETRRCHCGMEAAHCLRPLPADQHQRRAEETNECISSLASRKRRRTEESTIPIQHGYVGEHSLDMRTLCDDLSVFPGIFDEQDGITHESFGTDCDFESQPSADHAYANGPPPTPNASPCRRGPCDQACCSHSSGNRQASCCAAEGCWSHPSEDVSCAPACGDGVCLTDISGPDRGLPCFALTVDV